jgi:hypothetical protein
MIQEKVIYKFSDTDLCAYLMLLQYQIVKIEITLDKKYNNRHKAFIYFEGDKDTFIDIQNKYKNNEIFGIQLQQFSITKQKLKKLIKDEIVKFDQNVVVLRTG